MYSVKVKSPKMSFSSAHFVLGAGKCESLHGHNYLVEVRITGTLNEDSMVVDFRDIKRDVKQICDELDHQILLPSASHIISIVESSPNIEVTVNDKFYSFPADDCVVLPIRATTAELLAEYICSKLPLPKEYVVEVCVLESEGSIGCFSQIP